MLLNDNISLSKKKSITFKIDVSIDTIQILNMNFSTS